MLELQAVRQAVQTPQPRRAALAVLPALAALPRFLVAQPKL